VTLEGHYWYNRDALLAGEGMPAILELNPYRRRDGTMISGSKMYPWFALNECLCFRVTASTTSPITRATRPSPASSTIPDG
jgi:uncharacterized protein